MVKNLTTQRKLGKANFMHNGKKYSTKTKEEVAKKATRKKARGIRKKARKKSVEHIKNLVLEVVCQ